jgi:hypothetical protein
LVWLDVNREHEKRKTENCLRELDYCYRIQEICRDREEKGWKVSPSSGGFIVLFNWRAAYTANMNNQGFLSRIKRGAIAGLVATGPMTGVMEAYHLGVPAMRKEPLIPREVAEGIARRARFSRQVDALGEPGWWGLTLISHFGFGGMAGTAYGMIEPLLNRQRSNGARRKSKVVNGPGMPRNLAQGAVFGVLVWATHYLGLFPAMGLIKPHGDKPVHKNSELILSHLVWGMTTSLVYDSRRRRSQKSEVVPRAVKRRITRRV